MNPPQKGGKIRQGRDAHFNLPGCRKIKWYNSSREGAILSDKSGQHLTSLSSLGAEKIYTEYTATTRKICWRALGVRGELYTRTI